MPFLLAENGQKGPKLTKISHFDHLIVGNNDRFASNVAIFDEKCSFLPRKTNFGVGILYLEMF